MSLAKLSHTFDRLVHLSEQDLDGQTLSPRIPKNYLVEHGYEESSAPRVSFAPTEDGALIGLGMNLKGKEMYVHEPNDYSTLDAVYADVKDVPDAIHTKEVWVRNPVTLKRTGRIRVGEAEEEPLKYQYGPNEAETYRWNFERLASLTMDGMYKQANAFKRLVGRSVKEPGPVTRISPEEQQKIISDFQQKHNKDFYFGLSDDMDDARYIGPQRIHDLDGFGNIIAPMPEELIDEMARKGDLYLSPEHRGGLKKGVLISTDDKETLLHELGHVQDENLTSRIYAAHYAKLLGTVGGAAGATAGAATQEDTNTALALGTAGAASGVGLGLAGGLLTERSEDIANNYVKDHLTQDYGGDRAKAMKHFNNSDLPYYREGYRQQTIKGLKKPAIGGALGLGIGLGIDQLRNNGGEEKMASTTMSGMYKEAGVGNFVRNVTGSNLRKANKDFGAFQANSHKQLDEAESLYSNAQQSQLGLATKIEDLYAGRAPVTEGIFPKLYQEIADTGKAVEGTRGNLEHLVKDLKTQTTDWGNNIDNITSATKHARKQTAIGAGVGAGVAGAGLGTRAIINNKEEKTASLTMDGLYKQANSQKPVFSDALFEEPEKHNHPELNRLLDEELAASQAYEEQAAATRNMRQDLINSANKKNTIMGGLAGGALGGATGAIASNLTKQKLSRPYAGLAGAAAGGLLGGATGRIMGEPSQQDLLRNPAYSAAEDMSEQAYRKYSTASDDALYYIDENYL